LLEEDSAEEAVEVPAEVHEYFDHIAVMKAKIQFPFM
jgi:hypothetical protein